MKIDYKYGRVTNKTVDFSGTTEDAKDFTIIANWNELDDWTVDCVMWHDEESEIVNTQDIEDEFLDNIN